MGPFGMPQDTVSQDLDTDARAPDWRLTPLGPMAGWSARLRVLATGVIRSGPATCLFWGADGAMIFNAEWGGALGQGGAALLGRAAGEVSAALGDAYAAARRRAASGGAGEMAEALSGVLGPERGGALSCLPIPDDAGRVDGLLVQAPPAVRESAGTGPGGRAGIFMSPPRRSAAGRAGTALRDSGERHAFLVDLGDALRPVDGVAGIEATASRMLRERLGAARAWFRPLDAGADPSALASPGRVPGAPDVMAVGAIARALRGERAMVVRNAAADPRFDAADRARMGELSLAAILSCPVLAEGRPVAVLGVGEAAPRDWTRREIALAEAAAPRIWQEVLRAGALETLRANAARQALLLGLGDALRPLGDPTEIGTVAARMVAEHLGVAGAGFAIFETREGEIRQVPGGGHAGADRRHRPGGIAVLREDLLRGGTLAVAEAASDPRLEAADRAALAAEEIGHLVLAPLVRDGRVRAILAVHGPGARRWTAPEIDFLEEVAERVWTAAGHARAGAATRDSERRFRALVTATSEAIYRMSPDWREIRELDGGGFLRGASEPRTVWLADRVDPADRPELLAAMRRAVETKSVFELEHRVRRSDGNPGWAVSRAVPILDAEGSVVEWVGAVRDVTARRQAEAAVRQAESRLRLAQEAAGVATFDWKIPSDEADWSPGRPDGLGFQSGTLGGSYEAWIATIHPSDRAEATRCIEAAFDTGVLDGEWRVTRREGEILSVLVRGRIEYDAMDRPARLTGAQIDITERVLSEQRVRDHIAGIDAQIEILRRQLRSRGF